MILSMRKIMNETTKDKKVRILKALASIPGQTGSIDAIRRELKPPLDVDEIQKLLEAMWMESSIIPISRGYAFEGILVAKLSEQEQKYLKGKKKPYLKRPPAHRFAGYPKAFKSNVLITPSYQNDNL